MAGSTRARRADRRIPDVGGQREQYLKRAAPALLAGTLAAVYVIVSPPSLDLAAHLLRAKLFSAEGFGLWNNWWYGGHHVLLYSVLFPAAAAAIGPQLAAAAAATVTAILFDVLAHERWGERAWLGSLWFAAATATSLYTGRLTFAFGLAPAVGTALALLLDRPVIACGLGLMSALFSPVAALFAALVGVASATAAVLERRPRSATAGVAVAASALLPVAALAVAFPEGGTEPFAFSALWPIPVMAAGALILIGRGDTGLRAGIVLYTVGCVVSYIVPSAIGSNVARLAPLVAGPLAAVLLWPRRRWLLVALTPALLYVQWHAPVRDVATAVGDPSGTTAYYRPLIRFLARQTGPPFRVEIPFTRFHWEAYAVAPRFPLARGWERQLDIKYNHLFYRGTLTAPSYKAWLDELAVRFVAVSDSSVDYSATREVALINRGPSYLTLVARLRHWRVYRVVGATNVAQGAAAAKAIGPNWIDLEARRAGTVYVRVRYTPYWAVVRGHGCVSPAGGFTRVSVPGSGPLRLGIRFSLSRIGSRSSRCT